MKKYSLILGIISILVISGCQTPQVNQSPVYPSTQEEKAITNDNIINTYRDTRLLFQINYPRNWHITDYVNYDVYPDKCIIYNDLGSISEKYGKDMHEYCDEGTSIQIANMPVPFGGWNTSTIPNNFDSIHIHIYPANTYVEDYDANEPTAVLKEKTKLKVAGSENTLNILVYESKNYDMDDMMYPHIKAYFQGNSYTYEFSTPSDNPGSRLSPDDSHLKLFKEILSTFQEIK